jgi:hypothetical protein
MKSFRSKYLSILSAVVGIMTFVFSVNAEEWKLHPSFDRTPLRIIDTPEDTYFLVHQQIYDKSKVGYDFPSLTLFRYNKNATDKGITPLVHDVQLTSVDIRMADYSPKGDYLIVVYNDGGIDLIDKDMHLTHIDKLKRYTIPGMAKVTSVSFEPSTGDAWIGTDAGYMHVDAVSFTIQDVKVFDRGIDRICKFGDKLVVLSENVAWQSNGMNPLTFNEFKKISSVGSPSIMLPLGENEFAYVYGAPGSNSPINRVLKLARFDNSSWKVTDLGQDSFYSLSNNGTVVDRYESNFIPNKDGYLIYSASKVWQLYAPKDGESTRLVSISLDSNPQSLGSWDFSNFWCYRDRGTFVPRHADFTMDSNATSAAATWTDLQDPIRPNAPAAFICTYMDYSPKYGMLVINHGQEWHFRNDSPQNPPLLSGYNSSNEWKLYSYAYNTPRAVDSDESLRNIYKNNINRFPLPDPNGLLVDPFNPDWVSWGSMFGGFMFQNLSDIKSNPIKFAAKNDLFLSFPGIIAATPEKTWGTLCPFSPPTMDKNGTLWTLYSNAWSEPQCQIMFFTKEDREKLYSSDGNDLINQNCWHMIDVDYPEFIHWSSKLLALKHNSNNNKLLICRGESTSPIVILNHNGTLEDTSDDEIVKISKVLTETGEYYEFVHVYDLIEDPDTGDVLVLTFGGTIVFNPSNEIYNETIIGTIFKLNEDSKIPTPQINKACFGEDGILWLGSDTQGLKGVSKDKKKILYKYNTSNSCIPSNRIYGVQFNKDTRSIMMSTSNGLAEVFPEQKGAPEKVGNVSLNIYHVRPDYNGVIEIRNLSIGDNITITNEEDNEIRSIRNINKKIIEWDLKNKNGEKIRPGIYKIRISNQNELELIVM